MQLTDYQLRTLSSLGDEKFVVFVERLNLLRDLGFDEHTPRWDVIADMTNNEFVVLTQRLGTLFKSDFLKPTVDRKRKGRKPLLMPNTQVPLNRATTADLLKECEGLGLPYSVAMSDRDLRLIVRTALKSREEGE